MLAPKGIKTMNVDVTEQSYEHANTVMLYVAKSTLRMKLITIVTV